LKTLPSDILRARTTPHIHHPNRGLMAIVGANTFTTAMAEAIRRIVGQNEFPFFETYDQAMHYLIDRIEHDTKANV
jgi:hypothetical protein